MAFVEDVLRVVITIGSFEMTRDVGDNATTAGPLGVDELCFSNTKTKLTIKWESPYDSC